MTITSEVSYKRKTEVSGTSGEAEGVMSAEISRCRSRNNLQNPSFHHQILTEGMLKLS